MTTQSNSATSYEQLTNRKNSQLSMKQ